MESLMRVFGDLLTIVPKILLFLVILVIGWIVAKLLLNVVAKLLHRAGFERAMERSGLRKWTGDLDGSQLAAKLIYYAVLLFTLQLAFGVFGPNPVSRLITAIVSFIPKAFVALVILVLAAAIASAAKDVITSALGGLSYSRVLGKIAQVFILALGIIAALGQVGIAVAVTLPLLIALLATIGGVIVVGVGGGLIQPMRNRWERWLARGEAEMGTIRSRLEAADRTRTSTGATPQSSYTGQGGGAAVDPTHPRAAQGGYDSPEEPTVAMPQPGTQPGMSGPGTSRSGGQPGGYGYEQGGGTESYRGGPAGTR